MIAGIDKPTSGSLVVNGTRIDGMKTDRLAAWRGGNVGIVFQDFHLLPTLTAVENVELALDLGTDVGTASSSQELPSPHSIESGWRATPRSCRPR